MTAPSHVDDRGRWHVRLRDDDPPEVRQVADRLERAVADGRRLPPADGPLRDMLDTARRDAGAIDRKLMAVLQIRAEQCGLDRADRLALAETLLERDEVRSWSSLTAGDARRLLDAMHGFGLICQMQVDHGRRWRARLDDLDAAASDPDPDEPPPEDQPS